MTTAIKRKATKEYIRRRRELRNVARAFSIGMGGCLALNGQYYTKRLEKIVNTTDAQALRSDWKAVGDDMRSVMKSFKLELEG